MKPEKYTKYFQRELRPIATILLVLGLVATITYISTIERGPKVAVDNPALESEISSEQANQETAGSDNSDQPGQAQVPNEAAKDVSPSSKIPPTTTDTVEGKPATPPSTINLSVSTTFNEYYLKEPIVFTLVNEGESTATLSSGAPWRIENSAGKTVFRPFTIQTTEDLAPAGQKTWRWDQENSAGSPVEPGIYKIVFPDFGASYSFTINTKLGSSGYFTFSFNDGGKNDALALRGYFTNPETIRYAIDNYYKLNIKFPSGLIVDDRPGKSLYDAKYSWHLDPNETNMVDTAIELCDATPDMVEADLDYWVDSVQRFCPWGAWVSALE